MQVIAVEIRQAVEDASARLAQVTPEQAALKANPENWSKKELLGHLIDSACNNHQRFVRACVAPERSFPPYAQEEWVALQRYQEQDWDALRALWTAYNLYLCGLIERLPESAANAELTIGAGQPVTLEFLARDYLRHLRMHLADLLA